MTSKNTHSRSNESNLPEDIKASEADMAKLFAELPLPPMSELDDSLLRQASSAQAQSSSENMSPAASSGRGDSTVDSSQDKIVPFRQRDTFKQVLPRFFAAAAVLVLAVSVVPLIQQAPDAQRPANVSLDSENSTHSVADGVASDIASDVAGDVASDVASDLDSDASAELESSRSTITATAKTQSVVPEPIVAEPASPEEFQSDTVELAESEDQVDTSNVSRSYSSARTNTISIDSFTNATVEESVDTAASAVPNFRQTLTSWKEAIVKMVKDDQRSEAKREFKLLLEKYPEEAATFKPFADNPISTD